tara:strand:+ start:125 stop:1537 length:1413 start_codon:yes stop_codon:yes gene_type:complete
MKADHTEELPFISCKCITYGRTDLLVESLYSFLIQDYPKDKCELVIVNDYPYQKLHYPHPQVTVYNLDATFPLIGEKENFAIERCKGPLIAVWDDDDVAMPNHLMNIANNWKEDTTIMHWETGVLYNEPGITDICGVGNSGIVYSKNGWEKIGRSPLENAGGDMTLAIKLSDLGGKHAITLPHDQVSWFYMWGGRGYHQSGFGTDSSDKANIIQRHSAHIEAQRKKGIIPTGDIHLQPAWKKDYQKMLQEFNMKKVLVTTASFGSPLRYSTWVDQESSRYDITFNRVTDETETSRPLAMNPRLCAKMPKMLAWEDNPGYDYYIWMDSNQSLTDPTAIERMVDQCIDTDACFFKHSARSSVQQEVEFVLEQMVNGDQYILDRYEGEKMEEQLNHYLQHEDWNDNLLIECTVFIYSKDIVQNREYNLMKEWFYHNCIWSVQDQISLPYLLNIFKTKYKIWNKNVWDNDYTKR